MNALLTEMKRSLAELELGLKGDLTISEPMEKLMHALATDSVPSKRVLRKTSIDGSFRQLEKSGVSFFETFGILAQQSSSTHLPAFGVDGGFKCSKGFHFQHKSNDDDI